MQEALGVEGGAEYLREGRCQLTGGGRQLQSSEKRGERSYSLPGPTTTSACWVQKGGGGEGLTAALRGRKT